MLAVFDRAVALSPEGLRQPGAAGDGAAGLTDRFREARHGAVTVSIDGGATIAYSSHDQSPLLPRLFAVVDDIFCLFQGTIENIAVLKQQYGLSKGATEVNIIIEAYRTLRDRGPYPADQVIREISGKFAFVLYDYSTNSIFMAAGFRKVDPDRWEFANEGFLRGQRHLLKNIKRRKSPQSSPNQQSPGSYLEVGNFGYDGEIDQLKRDKQLLMAEVVKLRQEQQNTRSDLQAMEERLQGTEQKQQQMMAFLARVMRNPEFIRQLISQSEMRKELEDAISKKRRRRINQGPEAVGTMGTSSSLEQGSQVLFEPQEPADLLLNGSPSDLESSCVETKGFEVQQGFTSSSSERAKGKPNGELNDDFWEDLLHEGGLGDEAGNPVVQDDMNLLSQKMGCLNSNSMKLGQ